jgi:cytochrome d ubiquinol oxidase subunit II
VRGVSFEYRSKVTHQRWRTTWDVLLTAGSLAAPLLLGLALGNLLGGVPIGSDQEYQGNLWDLLLPYPLFVGVTLALLCVLHGATFLALKTVDDMRDRARRIARRIAPLVGLVVLVFASWTHLEAGRGFFPNVIEVAAVLAVFAAAWLTRDGQDGWAFTATTFAVVGSVVSIFVDLYPRVMVSSNGSATDLTIANTASGSYSLKVMTVVLALLLPVVLAYQGWTYYIFRRRVTRAPVAPARGARAAGRGGGPVAAKPHR